MGQLDEDDIVDDVLANLDRLEPVIDSVVRYLKALRNISPRRRKTVGRRILKAVRKKGASRYQIACLLSLFTHDREFDNADAFDELYERFAQEAKRELLLALGRARKAYWFAARRRQISSLDPWLRRAFVAGASCMESDARAAFFKTESRNTDVLDQALLSWVKANPF